MAVVRQIAEHLLHAQLGNLPDVTLGTERTMTADRRWQQNALALHPCSDNTCAEGVLLRQGMYAAALHLLAHATDWQECYPPGACGECFRCIAGNLMAFDADVVRKELEDFTDMFRWSAADCPNCTSRVYLEQQEAVGTEVTCASCRHRSALAYRLVPLNITQT